MHQRSFRIALGSLAETLSSLNLTTRQFHAFLQRREQMTFFLLLVIVIIALAIYFNETIELNNFTLSNKLLISTTDRDVHGSSLHNGICHLTGNGTFPNQFVQFTLLGSTFDGLLVHIGRTDGFVSLLSTLRTGTILANLRILFTIKVVDFFFSSIDTQAGKVDRVSTHIGDLSVLIQMLSHHHRLGNGKA